MAAEGECHVQFVTRPAATNGSSHAVGDTDLDRRFSAGVTLSGRVVVGRSIQNKSVVFDCRWIRRSGFVLSAYLKHYRCDEVGSETQVSAP